MYELTKMDIAALRQADYLSVHLVRGVPTVRATKKVEHTEANPFATDIDYVVGAPVGLTYYGGARDHLETAQCYCLLWLYPQSPNHETAVLRTLRAGDSVAFEFWPDVITSGLSVGMHVDRLYLHVNRGEKRVAKWEIETSVCPNNTARMCRGIPLAQ